MTPPALEAAPVLDPVERGIMEHAVAWHSGQRGYRNHYIVGPDADEWPVLQRLCDRGLMRRTRWGDSLFGGMSAFAVTDAGLTALGGAP